MSEFGIYEIVQATSSLNAEQRQIYDRLSQEKQTLFVIVWNRPGLMAREYGPLLERETGKEFYYGDMAQKLKELYDRALIDRAPIEGSRFNKVWRYYQSGRLPERIPGWEREVDDCEVYVMQVLREAKGERLCISKIAQRLEDFCPPPKHEHRLVKVLENFRRENKCKWRWAVTGPGGYKEYWIDGPHTVEPTGFLVAMEEINAKVR